MWLLSAALWLGVTVAVYAGALRLYVETKQHPLSNPVLLTAFAVATALLLSGTPYPSYAAAARPLHLLLGPATVALAVPVYRTLPELRGVTRAGVVAIASGALAATISAVSIARIAGASTLTMRSLAPKTVTTPIAMAISETIGGSPSATSACVVATGIFGALIVPAIFRLLRVNDPRARGLATGVACHGIGTARAFSLGQTEGAFATLGMGLSGAFVPMIVPLIARWF